MFKKLKILALILLACMGMHKVSLIAKERHGRGHGHHHGHGRHGHHGRHHGRHGWHGHRGHGWHRGYRSEWRGYGWYNNRFNWAWRGGVRGLYWGNAWWNWNDFCATYGPRWKWDINTCLNYRGGVLPAVVMQAATAEAAAGQDD